MGISLPALAIGGAEGGGLFSGLLGALGLGGAEAAGAGAAGAGLAEAGAGLAGADLAGAGLAGAGAGAGLLGDVAGSAGVTGSLGTIGTAASDVAPLLGDVSGSAGLGLTSGLAGGVGLPDVTSGGAGPGVSSTGGNTIGLPAGSAGIGTTPAAPGATAFTAPSGVVGQLGADPTAALTGNAAGGAGVGGAGTGAAPSGGGIFDSIMKGITPDLSKPGSLLGPAVAAGGLGYNILQGQKQSASVNALNQQAAQQNALGTQLEGYLTSGTLPPGLQASVTQSVKDAKTAAISNMAAQGLSTDPKQNSALAAELTKIDEQVPILTAQIGQQLLTSGGQAAGLSSQVYTTLANIDQTQTANMGKAIANMAAALSGKTSVPGTNITIGQTP